MPTWTLITTAADHHHILIGAAVDTARARDRATAATRAAIARAAHRRPRYTL